ncbi:RNA exonuclease, partial [Tremellales sp. Uapishka_1]
MATSPQKRKISLESPSIDTDEGFSTVLSRDEKRKKKKVEKRPQFQYDMNHFRSQKKIGIAHIRDFVLFLVAEAQTPSWIVTEHRQSISHTCLLFVPGLLPEHLGIPTPLPSANSPFPTASSTYSIPEPLPPVKVPIIAKLFTYAVPIRAPGDRMKLHSCVATLLNSPIPDNIRRKKESESRKLAALTDEASSTPLLYLLSSNQMLENDYKLPSYLEASDIPQIPGEVPEKLKEVLEKAHAGDAEKAGLDFSLPSASGSGSAVRNAYGANGQRERGNVRGEEGWIETKQAEGPPPGGVYPVLGIDCEMCLSEDGQELARVSVVDYSSGAVIFDKYVKPPKPITNYLTQWSGITPEMLASATETLCSIQHSLVLADKSIITPHTILLGHSLECDLAVLKIRHPLIIDTSVIYRHPRGPPYKPGLKWLAQKWLGKDIQGKEGGHDSAEDARCCVDLLRMKMANGPDFGHTLQDTESIFSRFNRFTPDPTKPGKSSAIFDYGNPRSWIGAKATLAQSCKTDEEVVNGLVENVSKYDFSYARLMELGEVQGCRSALANQLIELMESTGHRNSHAAPLPNPLSTDPPVLPTPDATLIDEALVKLNDRIKSIHDSLPQNTAFIIITGHANPLPMLELSQKRQKWERLVKALGGTEGVPKEERWLSEDDRELEGEVSKAREGMGMFCVK